MARVSGLKYSTARHLLGNRVYLGEVRIKDDWFPGRHDALVTRGEFDAASRGHVPGRRRGSDLLTGRVRCGMCGKLTAIDPTDAGNPSAAADIAARGVGFREDPPLASIEPHDSASISCGPMTS